MEVVPGVTYTIRVVEVTLLPGARRDLTPRELQINYVLEGVMTRRVGDQVLSYEPSSVLKLPIGATPLTASNERRQRFWWWTLYPVPSVKLLLHLADRGLGGI
jgi:hypothetical protein